MNEEFYQAIGAELGGLKSSHRFRILRTDTAAMPVNLSSNDYLGISQKAEWLREFLDTSSEEDLSMSAASSRLLTGNHRAYSLLEAELSKFYLDRSALVFNSGYHANSGIIPAIMEKGDLILSDKLNHASIIDGMMLSGAEFKRYRHLDYGHLEDILKERDGKYRRLMIISESIFSMDGDTADLKILVDLSKKYQAILYIDEAHGVGVCGNRGAGVCEESGTIKDIDIIVGTLGKAFCSAGAYAITRPELKDYLINRTRPFIFTTGLPPVTVNWTRFVLRKMPLLLQERANLYALGEHLRQGLQAKGYKTLGDTQIVPLVLGENAAAEELAAKLCGHGFLAMPVRPPTVPPGTARVRFSLHAGLTTAQLDNLLELL